MKTYFLGIAGAGVSALASILKTEGHDVIGSDAGVYPPISDYLDGLGIKYATIFDESNVPDDIDLAIIGTTSKIDQATNPEYQKIIRLGVPCYSFAEYLGLHTKGRELLVVAGSFGKSSITALIASILKSSGRDPGWFVGAIAKDLEVTGNWGKDAEFILEGDEYVVSLSDKRSKFELYAPKDILISSIVHDHVNMFPTMSDYETCFTRLLSNSPQDGLIFACADYEPIQRLISQTNTMERTIWYGIERFAKSVERFSDKKCDQQKNLAPHEDSIEMGLATESKHGFYVENIEIGEITKFTLCTPNNGKIPLATNQLGMHNIENIVAASAYCITKGLVDAEQLQKGVMSFNGVLRRLDKKTSSSKIPLFEGFGSSYEKARSAIEAMELHFPARPLWVVFEPHTFSWRNLSGLKWYDSVFDGVAQVLILPPPTHGAGLHEQVSIYDIVNRVKNAGVAVELAQNAEAVIASLRARLRGDETILLLSSGPLDGLANSLPPVLDAEFSDISARQK